MLKLLLLLRVRNVKNDLFKVYNQQELSTLQRDKDYAIVHSGIDDEILYPYLRFKDYVRFIKIGEDLYSSFMCKDKCILGFINNSQFDSFEKNIKQSEIVKYVAKMLNRKVRCVRTVEQYRKVFTYDRPLVVNVGLSEVPFEVPYHVDLVTTTLEIAKYFTEDIVPGMYIYKPCQFEFIKINKFDPVSLACEIDDIYDVNTRNEAKKYVAGFFVDNTETNTAYFIDLLKKLKQKYSRIAQFTQFSSDNGRYLKRVGALRSASGPIFAVFDSSNRQRRWFIRKEKVTDFTFEELEKFLTVDVDKKHIPVTVLSRPESELNLYGYAKEISLYQWKNDLVKSDKHILLALTTFWCGHCKDFKPILNATADVLKQYSDKLTIVFIDYEHNDDIEEVPFEIVNFPVILYYPPNNRRQPVQFEGRRDVNSLVQFLRNQTNMDLETTFDETELMLKYQ